MPSLVVGRVITPILHVSQIAAALGLAAPLSPDPAGVVQATVPVLRSWLDHLQGLDWRMLTAPTESRGRSLRNLTVNVFHPFELLPAAWQTLSFPWEPERDDEREALLTSVDAVVAYGARIAAGWADFVLANAEELGRRDPVVVSPRGEARFSAVLGSQLEHAVFHHDQLIAFLRARVAPRAAGQE